MPSRRVGGILYVQVRHAFRCLKCKAVVESLSRHDFRMCPCNSVGVDGGLDGGNRVIGDREHIEDLSRWRTEHKPYLWLESIYFGGGTAGP